MLKKSIALSALIFALFISFSLFFGCGATPTTTTSSTSTSIGAVAIAEKAIIEIPSSLTDETSTRNIVFNTVDGNGDDKMLRRTMKDYYSLVKSQLKLANGFSKIIKDTVSKFENIKIGDVELFKIQSEIKHTEDSTGNKIKFTPKGNDNFLFEYWIKQSDGSYEKFIEMDFTYVQKDGGSQVKGNLTLNTKADKSIKSENGDKKAETVKIDFDSDKNGKRYMKISLNNFKFCRDLDKSAKDQNAVLELVKDSSGDVEISGNILVTGSRWFVWNGYKSDNTIDLTSNYETRYYVFTGKVNSNNKATVNIGIAKDDYTDENVFTDYAIGKVIKDLYAQRLNKNYSFSSESNNSGRVLIKTMNFILKLSGENSLLLDETGDNTSEQLYKSFKKALEKITTAADKVYPNFLVSLMEADNPVYFIEGDYLSYGSVTPEGFFSKSDIDSILKISKSEVDNLSLKFSYPSQVDF